MHQDYPGGQSAKWLRGADNSWYFVKTNGEFWKWDGRANQLTGKRLASLDPDYYTNIGRLHDAQPNQVGVTLVGTTLTPAAGFVGDFWVLVKVNDVSQSDYEIIKLTVGNED